MQGEKKTVARTDENNEKENFKTEVKYSEPIVLNFNSETENNSERHQTLGKQLSTLAYQFPNLTDKNDRLRFEIFSGKIKFNLEGFNELETTATIENISGAGREPQKLELRVENL